jgi:hypothetical protein
MSNTGQKARHGMLMLVATTFSIACIIAVGYFVFLHPGTPIIPAPG